MNDEIRLLESCFRPANICDLNRSIPIEVITRAEAMKYILPLTLDGRSYQITDAGRARLEALLSSEQRAQEQAEETARKDAQKRADDLLAIKDKRKQRRHDFYVAAFSSAFTLFLEHSGDIIHFISELIGIAD